MNKQILRLAIPNIISNITVPLLGIIDLAVLGHLDSEIYIGAIALGGMIFNFIYWGFGFLRMGTTGFVAQAYGQNRFDEISYLLIRALTVSTIGGLLLIALQVPIAHVSFLLLKGSPEVEKLALQYFFIRIYAAPATIGLYGILGWFIGMQNARIPMFIAILVNGLNIGFNLLFVFGFGMKSDGVALGTVFAQYTGFVLALGLLFKHHRKLFSHWDFTKFFDRNKLKEFFYVNSNIFVRTLLLIFVLSFFTAQSAQQSNQILTVNTLLMQFYLFFAFFTDGFAYAAEALTGKYIGANNKPMLRKTIQLIFRWGIGLGISFSIGYFLLGKTILQLFTDNASIIHASMPYLWWVAILPIIAFASFLWDGIFIGATASKEMRNSMILSSLFVFFPSYFLLVDHLQNHALWLALSLFMLARSLTQYAMSRKITQLPYVRHK